MTTPTPVTAANIDQILVDLGAGAEHIERGQAEQPLRHEVEQLARPAPDQPLLLVLVSADAIARARTAAWLLGAAYVPRQAELFGARHPIEVQLIGGSVPEGYRGFDSLDACVGALTGPSPAAFQADDLLKLALPGPGLSRLSLVSMTPEAAIASAPWLLDRSLRQPSLLVTLAASAQAPSTVEQEALSLLSHAVAAIWPLCLFEGDRAEPPFSALTSTAVLPGETVGTWPQSTPGPIHGPDAAGLRRQIATLTRVKRALWVTEMIHERQGAEDRQLRSRQKRDQLIDRATPTVGGDAEVRLAIDSLRAIVADDFNRLAKSLRERTRRAGLRTGDLFQTLEELLANVRETDLDQEVVGKKIRLSLHQDVVQHLKSSFADSLKADIEADCGEFDDTLNAIRTKATPQFIALGLSEDSLRLHPVPIDQIWGPIEEAIFVQARYRGEIPKRGFLERLGEGRRVVFVILMMGSLAGGFMGFNIRRMAGMGPVFLLLFIGVVAYTFRSWKAEDKEIMEAELLKLRDILFAEFSRLLQEALRERQTRLQTAIDESRRDILLTIDGLQRDAAQTKSSASEADRKAARARLKLVEARLKDLGGHAQALGRIRHALERHLTDIGRGLRSAAVASPGAINPAPAKAT